jgi:membrane protein insertase Oxa1/YidC/SpoIIIJ
VDQGLSSPDPLHVLNLFGLLPFDPPSFLGIGILAILLGITMWLQFKPSRRRWTRRSSRSWA